MSQKNDTPILILALLITAAILGGCFWLLTRPGIFNFNIPLGNQTPSPTSASPPQPLPSPPTPGVANVFPPPTTVPSGTTLTIDGSTSIVQINQALKQSFEQQFPGTIITTNAQGSEKGIAALIAGNIDIAGVSRPLTPQEIAQGLEAVAITRDTIAIFVGDNNPFRTGLTQNQVIDIFTGKVTNWPAIDTKAIGTIKVINRPASSGTHQVFQEIVLKGASFGNTPNFITMSRDATTPILQALGKDGISYATYGQVAKQQTVRTVPIDGLTPEASNYPYQRTLYYVYKKPANSAVQYFLGYATSPQGQQIINSSLIVP